MLYCPNCKQTYEEGTQRFCTNDGLRLLPEPLTDDKPANQTSGVFTNIFNRASTTGDSGATRTFTLQPDFSVDEPENAARKSFRPPVNSRIFKPESKTEAEVKLPSPTVKIFKDEPAFELELGDGTEAENQTSSPSATETSESGRREIAAAPVQKTAPRIVNRSEVSSGQATLGDRKTNPTGRAALTRENPEALLGQTIKGRYRIAEKLGENESGIVFLAEDKIVGGKRVAVRILTDEDAGESFAENVFAEERVSLSHVNHPNVASVIDSGVLPEGKPFIVTEYVEGKSVKTMLAQSGQFNVLRAARVVRQAAYALSEMHQNGIAHRGLTAENIVLTVADNGSEQVKLTDFAVESGKHARENFQYKAPEQIEGREANFSADLYSLAVVAYQMLTNRLPFNGSSAKNHLREQREAVKIKASDLRLDVTPTVDEILQKALAFNPSARYPKARDFGDALFNQVTTAEVWQNDADKTADEIEIIADEDASDAQMLRGADLRSETAPETENIIADSKTFSAKSETDEAEQSVQKKSADDLPWERRSPEPPKTARMNWATMTLLAAVVVAALGILYYAANRPTEPAFVQTPPPPAANAVAENEKAPETPLPQKSELAQSEIESPPSPRNIAPPSPESVYFENSKQNLKKDAAKNFLGFSLYHPKDWRQNDAKNNFLDISKNAQTGTPVEQMLISFYDSRGTFKLDRDMFPKLVKEKTESQLKPFVPNYRTVSEGETTVNGGWRAYEIKFEGAGKTAAGENIKLFGRRLYIPAARNGMKNGYVLTLLATSLSPVVKSVEDVGVKGDLESVLNTFEPNQNF